MARTCEQREKYSREYVFKAGNESLPFLLSELGASSCGKIYMMTERTGIA